MPSGGPDLGGGIRDGEMKQIQQGQYRAVAQEELMRTKPVMCILET